MLESATVFAPLEERAATKGQSPDRDRISVRDFVTEVEIGAFQSERDVLQRLKFSVVVEVAASSGAQTDDVDDILSYDAITEAIIAELQAERLNLLETLADRIALRILGAAQSRVVYLRVEKLDRGPGDLGVEIVRYKEQTISTSTDETQVTPRIVLCAPEAFTETVLKTFIDRIVESGQATILCVHSPSQDDVFGPERHIALLSLEQDVWRLAMRDVPCVPVGSRTELDWGLKNGQLSVWTPSKMVLDAVDGPVGARADVLAVWLGDQFGVAQIDAITFDGSDRNFAVNERIKMSPLEDWI